MAVTVQFDHHITIDGVNYVPGMIASLPDLTAQPLIFSGRVHVANQSSVTSPGTPSGDDPYPQYLLPTELEGALPNRLTQASLNATIQSILAGYTFTSGGSGSGGSGSTTTTTQSGSVLDNGDGTAVASAAGTASFDDDLDGTGDAEGFLENSDHGDGTAGLTGGTTTTTGGGSSGGLSSSDADALVTRAVELSIAYMRDYFSGA